MMPLMDKDTVRYITQNITPEEAEYVAGIRSTIDDTDVDVNTKQCDDIIYITKLIAFAEKFRILNWQTLPENYRYQIQDFQWRICDYKDNIALQVQSIIGQIKGSDITKIELPLSSNPLEIINELKQCVTNWLILHNDDMEYEGARHITSGFLADIHKYIYTFRLAKISNAKYNNEDELKGCCIKQEEAMSMGPNQDWCIINSTKTN